MCSWNRAVMKVRHRRRWEISFTELVWLLIAATAAIYIASYALSERTWTVLPLKMCPMQVAFASTIGISSLMEIWYFYDI